MGLLKGFLVCCCLWCMGEGQSHAKTVHIITTFNILEDIIKNVVGDVDDITVDSIVKANQDPHLYEPTPHDAKLVAQADIIFLIGLTFEDSWVHKLIKSSGFKGKQITVSAHIKNPRTLDADKGQLIDPHVWHDVSLAQTFIPLIRDALITLIPNKKEIFTKNAFAYEKALQVLHQEIIDLFNSIPQSKRKIVTTHDAFHYLCNYGVEVYAPLGISTDAEASAQEIITLIKKIKSEDIKAIFMENVSNDKLVKQIAREAFKDVKVDRTLYADTLSLSNGPAPTYIMMIRHNTKMIIDALKGQE